MNKYSIRFVTLLGASALLASVPADAQRGGRGSRAAFGSGRSMQVRGASTSNLHWSGRTTVNRDIDRNVNRRVDVDRNVSVDVDHHYDYDWGDHYHPVARAATAAAVTAAVVGTYYRYLPADCVTVYRGTIVYYQCATGWYRPVYSGTAVQYVVVTAP